MASTVSGGWSGDEKDLLLSDYLSNKHGGEPYYWIPVSDKEIGLFQELVYRVEDERSIKREFAEKSVELVEDMIHRLIAAQEWEEEEEQDDDDDEEVLIRGY